MHRDGHNAIRGEVEFETREFLLRGEVESVDEMRGGDEDDRSSSRVEGGTAPLLGAGHATAGGRCKRRLTGHARDAVQQQPIGGTTACLA